MPAGVIACRLVPAERASAAYLDPSRTLEERVRDLLDRMTLEEKLAQLGAVWGSALAEGDRFSAPKAKQALHAGIGHITRIAGGSLLGPRQSAELANEIQRFLIEDTRLGVPAIVHEESCAGYTARGATCFPQAIGLASTFEPELIEKMALAIRRQMRAVGAHQALAPVLDLARDPRWGRTEETYGEDPYLASRIGVAYVRGLQGDDLSRGIVATGKHFVGYGAPAGGLNWAPAQLGRRELLEQFTLPFDAAIREAGLASVMNAYCEIDGVPCGASRELLEDLLRGELGFDGVVVADYFTVQTLLSYHRISERKEDAARSALEAGIDVELPALDFYGEPLREAIEAGRMPIAPVDRAVSRVLRMKFELGLFEDPYVNAEAAPAAFDTPEQRALARRLAQQSIVLLKNENDLLPLERSVRKLAVIGPAADSARLLQGDYHYPTHLEMLFSEADLAPYFVPTATLLDGIRRAVSDGTEISTASGCDVLGDPTADIGGAVEVARGADVAILVVGGKSGLVEGCTSGEASDRADLGLPGRQQELVEAVVGTGTPSVVVLVNGRPLALPWLAEHVPALVEAWLPGEEGGHAVADVLFGAVSPGGKLPVSLPRSVGQLPVHYNHKPSGGRSQRRGDYVDPPTRPLFPFGHGLSYGRFEYSDLELGAGELAADGTLEVRVAVCNVGARAGEEVVQVYVRDLVASVTRPVLQLVGFKRIALEPGETRRLLFYLDLGQLAFFGPDMQLAVEPGEVELRVGSSSEDIRADARFRIVGERRLLGRADISPTRVEVR